MHGQVLAFLDGSLKWAGPGQTIRFLPKPSHADDVLRCLKSTLALPDECQPPMWLDTGQPARDVIAFRNGIVNLRTGEASP